MGCAEWSYIEYNQSQFLEELIGYQHMTRFCFFLFFCIITLGLVSTSHAAGNVARGASKAAACAGCHGKDGNSIAPMFPRLAGQNEAFLVRALSDFKAHLRADPSMEAFAAGLSSQDIGDLSAYFSSQKPIVAKTSGEQYVDEDEEIPVTSELIARGATIFQAGNETSGVAACSACHGPTGSGNAPAGFPVLKGQFLPYLIKSLNDFREGYRTNDDGAIMRTITKKMSRDEINAVSAYISNLR